MEPYLSEIRLFSFPFAPSGWAQCNGQIMAINQNQALFALLGTRYGGDGRTTFALPDLRGRVPMHVSPSYPQGQLGGEEFHTLTISEMPTHTHTVQASSNPPDSNTPLNNFWASNTGFAHYGTTPDRTMSPAAITNAGGSQGHENRAPFLTLNYCIAIQGIFPTRN